MRSRNNVGRGGGLFGPGAWWPRGSGGLGDAFRYDLGRELRLPAQRIFYDRARRAQKAVVDQIHGGGSGGAAFGAKVQLDPCYSDYPALLSARAAIGLTAFLEFKAQAGEAIYTACMDAIREREKDGTTENRAGAEGRALGEVLSRAVQRRLILQELSRIPGLGAVESYRLFCASRLSVRMQSLKDLLDAVILFDDILPLEWERNLHPVSRKLVRQARAGSRPFLRGLACSDSAGYLQIGTEWVCALHRRLAGILARRGGAGRAPDPGREEADARNSGDCGQWSLPPLREPFPPGLDDSGPLQRCFRERLEESATDQERKLMALKCILLGEPPACRYEEALSRFSKAARGASRPAADPDGSGHGLMASRGDCGFFEEGEIQEAPVAQHQIKHPGAGDSTFREAVYDQAVLPSADARRLRALLDAAGGTTEALRRMLYPNLGESHRLEGIKGSGMIDPARLAISDVADAIFRRRVQRTPEREAGPSLLVMACDGSASLNGSQMRMLKILSTAWLSSAAGCRIRILAGLYHSQAVGGGRPAPVVRWIWHPEKSPVGSPADAVACVAALPDSGTGAQSDALSLRFIMDQARSLAGGSCVYLVHITDCVWNRSRRTSKRGLDEVRDLYQELHREYGTRLHTTLVALGAEGGGGLEDLAHKVIPFTQRQLEEGGDAAKEIALYTASCIRERRAPGGL